MNLRICLTCYLLFLFLYSVIIIAIEATSLYVGLTFVILPFLCFILLDRLAIPKPQDHVVNCILGVNLWQAERERSNLNNESESSDELLTITTIGHRACGLDAPENSIAAMELCKSRGCKCIEIDLWLTADNVAVVFHDSALDRMTDGTGLIGQNTLEQLRRLKLIFQPEIDTKRNFPDVRIPTFDESIDFCLRSNMRVIIDVKDCRDEMVNILIDAYRKQPLLYAMSIVSSFNAIFLYKLRLADRKIVCSMAWRPEMSTTSCYDPIHDDRRSNDTHFGAQLMDFGHAWLFDNLLYYLVGISVVLLHKDALSGRTLAKWQKRGIRVMAWTVNSKIEKDYFANIMHIPYLTDTLEYAH